MGEHRARLRAGTARGGAAEWGPGTGDRAWPPETMLAPPVHAHCAVSPGCVNQNPVSGRMRLSR